MANMGDEYEVEIIIDEKNEDYEELQYGGRYKNG